MAAAGRNAFRAVEDWRNKRSVWTVPTKPFAAAHFATFPPGGVVLDPFLGAGTTACVAAGRSRRCIGIELNGKYLHEIAVPRIRMAQAQQRLFA